MYGPGLSVVFCKCGLLDDMAKFPSYIIENEKHPCEHIPWDTSGDGDGGLRVDGTLLLLGGMNDVFAPSDSSRDEPETCLDIWLCANE